MIKTVIIDDHSLFNDGLASILKEHKNFKVIEQIYDSRQAYYKCISLRPDLLIVDYNMPNLNGLEVVKQIKSLNFPSKIVIVSMYADRKEIALFINEGVDGYINKTTAASDLIKALNKIMEGEQVIIGNVKEKTAETRDAFSLKHQLTKRETEILRLLKDGFSTEQVAQHLKLSFYTIETHRKNINQKMKFSSKKEYYDFLEGFTE
jgi:DNA-binding NarL/FixJ family response regulator